VCRDASYGGLAVQRDEGPELRARKEGVYVPIGQRVATLVEDGGHEREGLLCQLPIRRAETTDDNVIVRTRRYSDVGIVHITLASAAGDRIKRERSELPSRPTAASIVRLPT